MCPQFAAQKLRCLFVDLPECLRLDLSDHARAGFDWLWVHTVPALGNEVWWSYAERAARVWRPLFKAVDADLSQLFPSGKKHKLFYRVTRAR